MPTFEVFFPLSQNQMMQIFLKNVDPLFHYWKHWKSGNGAGNAATMVRWKHSKKDRKHWKQRIPIVETKWKPLEAILFWYWKPTGNQKGS